jgi:hypothetical protein
MIDGSGVRFLAPAIRVSLGQALESTSPRKIVRMVISAAMCACILPRKMRPCRCEFQYQGRYCVKSVELTGILDYE